VLESLPSLNFGVLKIDELELELEAREGCCPGVGVSSLCSLSSDLEGEEGPPLPVDSKEEKT